MAEPLFNIRTGPNVMKPGLGSTANTTSSTVRAGDAATAPANFVKEVVQGTARGAAALGQATASKLTGGYIPPVVAYPTDGDSQRLYRAIYGTTQSISLQSVGEEYPFVKPGSKVAPVVAVAGTLLDALPGGKGLTSFAKNIAKSTNLAEITRLMRGAGLAEDIVTESAPRFVQMAKETEVLEGLKRLQELQKTTRNVGQRGADVVARQLGAKERGFVTSVKEEFPQLTKVAGQYIPRDTDTLAVKARNFVRENAAAAEKLAREGTNEDAVATAAELLKKLTNDAANAADDVTRAALHDHAAEIANAVAQNLTELGRSVQAASILSRLTPEGMARFAARTIQKYNESVSSVAKRIPELSGEQIGRIVSRAKAIQDMPDGVEKAMKWRELMDEISALVPTPLWKKMVTLWKAGLLTGFKTSGLNILSNLFHGTSEVVKDIPASVVDRGVSLFTGKRAVGATLKGTLGGTGEGFKKGWRYLRTGFDERDIASKLDYGKVNFGTSPIARGLQKYEEAIFRIIGSEDQPFFYGAKARSIADQASVAAKNEGLKGPEAVKRAQQLLENPTDDMLKYAMLDAETAVFQNKTGLGSIAKSIQRIPGAEFLVPFGRTPSAVATQIMNYSPIGAVKTIIQNWGKRFDQRIFSQGIGRSLTGTAIGYIGYKLYDMGLVALGYPKSEGEQKLWELEGKKPNSIKIGGEWRSPAVLGSAGNVILAGAYFREGVKDTGSMWGGLARASAGGIKTVKEQTFLVGLNSFLNALDDPNRVESFVSRQLGSVVPTIISDVARATDKYERRTDGFTGGLKSRLPGVRNEVLEPKVDTLGSAVETPGPFTTMFDPTRPVKSRVGDPVVAELRRLSDAGFASTPTQLGDKNGYKSLTPKENTRLWQVSGVYLRQKLNGLIQAPQYQTLDDEGKSKAIKNFTDKVKVEARAAMVLELTAGLTGPELMNALAKHKESGLMSKEVYERYLELR